MEAAANLPSSHNISSYPDLKDVLPTQYKYKVLHYAQESAQCFQCYLRLHITTKTAALNWLQEFEKSSRLSYRVDRTHPENTSRIIFKKEFRCHYSSPDLCSLNNGRCTAKVTITIKKRTMSKSKDRFLLTHPCEIFLRQTHNHPIPSQPKATTQPVTEEFTSDKVEPVFLSLFRHGHSPSTALDVHEFDLQQEHGDLFCRISTERVECPDVSWCDGLFYQHYQKSYHEPKRIEPQLGVIIDDYNASCGIQSASLESNKDNRSAEANSIKKRNATGGSGVSLLKNNLIDQVSVSGNKISVALVTPLMRRIYDHLDSTNDVMFVDEGFRAKNNVLVFVLVAYSPIGSLPVGAVIIDGDDNLTSGFRSVVKLLRNDDDSWKGPRIVMTSNDVNERNALVSSFPNSSILVCAYQVLEELRAYLWDAKNEIDNDDRIHLFGMFKKIINSENEALVISRFQSTSQDAVYQKYRKLQQCMNKLFERRKEWLICCQDHNRTTLLDSWTESATHEIREKILGRASAFNIVQLFHFLSTRLDCYYKKKMMTIIDNQSIEFPPDRFPDEKLTDLVCTRLCDNLDNLYNVENVTSGNRYIVDVILETCSCPGSTSTNCCKHQFAVAKKFNLVFGRLGTSLANLETRLTLKKILKEYVFPGAGSQIDLVNVESEEENVESVEKDTFPVIYCDISKCTTLEEFQGVLDNLMCKLKKNDAGVESKVY